MKKVLCYKCLHVYDLDSVKWTPHKDHKTVLEKKCPNCKCKVYYS